MDTVRRSTPSEAKQSHSLREWQETTYQPAIKRAGERGVPLETSSGIPIRPLYTPEDLPDFDYGGQLGYPGEYPFARGVQPTMYRSRLWTMRQYAGYGTAEESNRRYRYLLDQGQTGLSVAFDLPTQIGYDSDDPRAEGEVGKVGVAIDSLEDMEALFAAIPLDRVSTSMTINATAPILLALYVAVGRRHGVDEARLAGTVQNDILKEYIARGTYIYPPRPSMRLITDVFRFCAERLPLWNSISISGYHIREAGATAAQELAFTLANAVAYVQAAVNAGLAVDTVGPRLSFFFNAHNDLFEEVAKFRAARRMWARLMRERFGARDPRSWMLRFHTQTAGSALTAQQPNNNVIRSTIHALAAILGGTQSLHVSSRDEALALPSEESAEISLRTQQVLGHESGVTETVDPLAGSYYVESLTDELERRAGAYIERIDALGGAMAAIDRGFQQAEIQESAYRYQREVEQTLRVVVGVNRFSRPEQRTIDILRVDPAVRARQIERLVALRARRDGDRVAGALAQLEAVARGTGNTMPAILEAVEACATLGEIAGTLRRVFGEYRETIVI
ncbi:MAG: methylmalonyl-CoA mutase family protein [Chloroflexi bacterium]|nr:methylmalonyl-CoA mutase family protein [Chloroflexota bacterium]